MSKFWHTAIVCVALSGCAVGITGDQQARQSFASTQSVEVALAAAQAQALACLTGNGSYHVQRLPGGNADSGSIVVRAAFTQNDMARVDVSRQGAGSRVDIAMWGRNLWNAEAVTAMKDAITFNVVACKSYMPMPAPAKKG